MIIIKKKVGIVFDPIANNVLSGDVVIRGSWDGWKDAIIMNKNSQTNLF